MRETFFHLLEFFLISRNSLGWFWGSVLWHLGLVGPGSLGPSMWLWWVFNVGRWVTHGDFALEAEVDYLAVVEHRLIPAGVRSEWSRLRAKGLASSWALASLDSSHNGNAGVVVVSMRSSAYFIHCPVPALLVGIHREKPLPYAEP